MINTIHWVTHRIIFWGSFQWIWQQSWRLCRNHKIHWLFNFNGILYNVFTFEFELSKLKTCFLVLLGEFIVLRQVFTVSIVQRSISMVTNTPNSTHFIMIMIIIRQQLSYKRAKTPIFAMVTDIFGDIFNLIDINIPIMALCRLLYSNNWSKSTNFKNFNSYFCSNCFVFYKLLLFNKLKSYERSV